MTELSFLIDLLLNGRLSTKTKALVQQRIVEVETNMSLPQAVKQYQRAQVSAVPIETLTHNEVTVKALADRQAAIQAAINQKPQEVSTGNGTKGPRKF